MLGAVPRLPLQEGGLAADAASCWSRPLPMTIGQRPPCGKERRRLLQACSLSKPMAVQLTMGQQQARTASGQLLDLTLQPSQASAFELNNQAPVPAGILLSPANEPSSQSAAAAQGAAEHVCRAVHAAASLQDLHSVLSDTSHWDNATHAAGLAVNTRALLSKLSELYQSAHQRQQQDQGGIAAGEADARTQAQELLSLLAQRLCASQQLSCLSSRDLAHLATCMVHLRLHDPELLRQVVNATWGQTPVMSAGTASTLLWATATLHKSFKPACPAPPPAWLDALLERVQAGSGVVGPGLITQALHSVAVLQHSPPQDCLAGILQAVEHRLDEWQGPSISGLLWALAAMGHDPGGPWIAAVLARSEACTRSFGSGTSLASLLWALATLRRAPSASFMNHFLWQVQRRLSVCNSHALSNIAWALAVLQYRPNPAWVAEFLRAAGKQLGVDQQAPWLSKQGSKSSSQQPQGTQQAAAAQAQAPAGGSAPVAGPASLLSSIPPAARWSASQTTRSAVSKGLQQGSGFPGSSNGNGSGGGQQGSSSSAARGAGQAAGLAADQSALTSTTIPQSYANMLWAFAKLGVKPRAPYLRQLCSAITPSLDSFTPRDLAHTVWGLQRMRFLPDQDWMLEVHVALRARLTHFDTPSLVMTLVALGGFASVYRPDESLMRALYLQLTPRVPRLGLHSTSAVCIALSRLASSGGLPRPLHEALLAHVSNQVGSMGVRHAATVAYALTSLAQHSSDLHLRSGLNLLPRLIDRATAQLWPQQQGQRGAGLEGGAGGGVRQGQDGAPRQRPGVTSAASAGLSPTAAPKLQDLVQLLMACRNGVYCPGSSWLVVHEGAVCRLVRQTDMAGKWVKGRHGSVVMAAYKELGHDAERLRMLLRAASQRRLQQARQQREVMLERQWEQQEGEQEGAHGWPAQVPQALGHSWQGQGPRQAGYQGGPPQVAVQGVQRVQSQQHQQQGSKTATAVELPANDLGASPASQQGHPAGQLGQVQQRGRKSSASHASQPAPSTHQQPPSSPSSPLPAPSASNSAASSCPPAPAQSSGNSTAPRVDSAREADWDEPPRLSRLQQFQQQVALQEQRMYAGAGGGASHRLRPSAVASARGVATQEQQQQTDHWQQYQQQGVPQGLTKKQWQRKQRRRWLLRGVGSLGPQPSSIASDDAGFANIGSSMGEPSPHPQLQHGGSRQGSRRSGQSSNGMPVSHRDTRSHTSYAAAMSDGGFEREIERAECEPEAVPYKRQASVSMSSRDCQEDAADALRL